jgi:hypothetical protein
MFTKNDNIYADVGYYLRNKTNNSIALMRKGDVNDWEELPLNDPIDIQIDDTTIFINDRKFIFKVPKLTYNAIKTKIITSRYSNDDQMALILNNGQSELDTMYYNKMQEWRDWAGKMAKLITNK